MKKAKNWPRNEVLMFCNSLIADFHNPALTNILCVFDVVQVITTRAKVYEFNEEDILYSTTLILDLQDVHEKCRLGESIANHCKENPAGDLAQYLRTEVSPGKPRYLFFYRKELGADADQDLKKLFGESKAA